MCGHVLMTTLLSSHHVYANHARNAHGAGVSFRKGENQPIVSYRHPGLPFRDSSPEIASLLNPLAPSGVRHVAGVHPRPGTGHVPPFDAGRTVLDPRTRRRGHHALMTRATNPSTVAP